MIQGKKSGQRIVVPTPMSARVSPLFEIDAAWCFMHERPFYMSATGQAKRQSFFLPNVGFACRPKMKLAKNLHQIVLPANAVQLS